MCFDVLSQPIKDAMLEAVISSASIVCIVPKEVEAYPYIVQLIGAVKLKKTCNLGGLG